MATLAGSTIASTYPLLLKIDSNGIDGTLRAIEDGDGTDSAVKISTGAMSVDGNVTITTTDNSVNLTLKSTDADASSGPILDLFRASASAADDDYLGIVRFSGKEASDGDTANYAQIIGRALDVTAGTPDGRLEFEIVANDSGTTVMSIAPHANNEGYGVGIGTTAPVNMLEVEFDDGSNVYEQANIKANAASGILISNTGDSTGRGGVLHFTSHDGGNNTAIVHTQEASNSASLRFFTESGGTMAESLLIDHDGVCKFASSLKIPEYIIHDGDANTHFRMRADEIILTTGGNNCVNIGTTEVRFNHDAQNIDFAIETQNNGNMFVVDAAEDKIAIGGNSRWASPGGSSSGSACHVTIAGSLRLDSMSTSTGSDTDIDSIQFVKAHALGVGTAQYTIAEIRSFTNGGYEGGLNFWTSASAGGGSYDISKRMVITGPGKVGIKEDSPDAYLHVKNAGGATPALKLEDNSSGVSSSYVLMDIDFSNDADIENGKFIIFQDSDGVMGSISGDDNTTTYATTSDYRKKTDFKDVVDATGTINKLKLYDFAWKKNTDKRAIGVIAHEAEEVFPNAIVGEKDAMTTKIYKDENGDKKEKEVELPQQVDYSKFVPILLKSIQELSAKVEALENA